MSDRLRWILAVGLAGAVACASGEQDHSEDVAAAAASGQNYPNVNPSILLDDDRLTAQRLDFEPDSWTGEHGHDGNQIVVVLEGGTTTYREGGVDTPVEYADGETFWIDAVESHDHTGDQGSAILITLKDMVAGDGGGQEYPNTEPSVLFENNYVVVQRLASEPGVWAGEHGHDGNQFVVSVSGGTTTFRENGEDRVETLDVGAVRWVEATDAHDHANTGDSASDAILITFKG